MKIVVSAAISVILVAAGLWLSRDTGGGEQVISDGPAVEGRLFWGSVGMLRDGSGYHARCEADAHVRVERDTIVEILEHGDRPEIKVGEKIDRDPSYDPSLTDEDIQERGTPPVSHAIWVYRDEEGVVRGGCSPESIVVIDDVVKSHEEWVAKGRLETPRPQEPTPD